MSRVHFPSTRRLRSRTAQSAARSEGQTLVLFAACLFSLLAFVAMSVDVGQLVWARTQMQAAVDASALAAAQSMPDLDDAEDNANVYWLKNSGFIQSQGENVSFDVSFPSSGNRAVVVKGKADIPTWFARFVGIPKWTVSASAQSESQVVDAVLVLDRSGSMCFDSHGPNGNFVGNVALASSINATQTTLPLTKSAAVASRNLSSLVYVGQVFRFENSSNSEWLLITAIDNSSNTIAVIRGVSDPESGVVYAKSSHSAGRWIRGSTCQAAGSGPYHPWEEVKGGGELFVGEFDARYDRIGFVHFATRGVLAAPLTAGLGGLQRDVSNAPDPTAYGSADAYTNIAHGLYLANSQLVDQARRNARRVVVLLSDGVPNTYCSPVTETTTCTSTQRDSSANGRPRNEALAQADYAAANGITVYTIGYGRGSDDDLMKQIAERTGGAFYKAPDAATLEAAFLEIAHYTRTRLTE